MFLLQLTPQIPSKQVSNANPFSINNLKTNIMKNNLVFALYLSLTLIVLISCKKTKDITCDLSTSASQPPVEMNVLYTASQTGDGTISSLTYATISGPVTVQNPALPWTVTVPVLTSTNVTMSATGTTRNGSLTITYDGFNGGVSIHGTNSCEQQTSK
jgi:hypothetical protein